MSRQETILSETRAVWSPRERDFTVSVVIAARNSERTIQRALASALYQSHPPVEVIVVDDMSADSTKHRALDLRNDRVIVVDGEGRGQSAARNAGVRRARGAWVAFLDSDDFWAPKLLELARERIGSAPHALACFAAATPIDDEGRVVGFHDVHDVVSLEDLARGRVVPTTSATLVRRSAAIACGGFSEDLRWAEDLDLWLRLSSRGLCVGVTKPSAFYVVHDERDRQRPIEALLRLERDRELVVDRLAAAGARPELVRRARAIMRARTARYWLRADKPKHARTISRASLRARPTIEGLVTLALASTPNAFRAALVRHRRRFRAANGTWRV
jgi:glycosyltransferase involved in cell wall biosynthesis